MVKKVSFKKTASKAYVKNLLNATTEKGYAAFTLPSVFGSIGNAWIERSLAQPSEGTDVVNRIGRKIRVKSIEVNGILASGATDTVADDISNVVRLRLSLNNPKSATPLVTAGAGMSDPLYKDTVAGEYLIKTYKDMYIPLEAVSTGQGDGYTPSLKRIRFTKRFKHPVEITFASIDNTKPDKLFFLSMISDSLAVLNPGFTQGYCILRYEM